MTPGLCSRVWQDEEQRPQFVAVVGLRYSLLEEQSSLLMVCRCYFQVSL